MSEIHLDQTVLSALQDVMEDEFPMLLDIFLADSDQRLHQLHRAVGAQDLILVAHTFKGSSSNMGAIRLAQLCGQLEERAHKRQLAGIETLVSEIDREYQQVRRLYSAERQRFSASGPASGPPG